MYKYNSTHNLSQYSINESEHDYNEIHTVQPPITYSVGTAVNNISVSADQKTLACITNKDIHIYNIQNNNFQPITTTQSSQLLHNVVYTDTAYNTHISHSELLCCSLSNGGIVLYNVNQLKRSERYVEDHDRCVNRVVWHPIEATTLLSAAQDGTVKLWDFRMNSKTSQATYSDTIPVRDVQINLYNPTLFASAYDNGSVQLWDTRKGRLCTINAHQSNVLSLDWHMIDSDILVTAGNDRYIHVWAVNEAISAAHNNTSTHSLSRRNSAHTLDTHISQAKHTIQTAQPVSKIRWRPNCAYQIACTSNMSDYNVSVYNVVQPYIPLCTTHKHNDVVTGMLFRPNGDDLITCSKDGYLRLFDVAHCSVPSMSLNTTAVSFNVYNQVATVTDQIDRHSLINQHNHISIQPGTFKFVQYNAALNAGISKLDLQRKSTVDIADIQLNSKTQLTDIDIVLQLAHTYKCNIDTNNTLQSICKHNADAAIAVDRHDVAHTWRLLAILYNDNTQSTTQLIHHKQTHNKHNTALSNALPNVQCNHHSVIKQPLFRDTLLHSIMQQAAERGDIQLNCYIVLLFNHTANFTDQQIQQYCYNYIELLQRLQQYTLATEIIQLCTNTEIQQINQKSTTISVLCMYCNKGSNINGSVCDTCYKLLNQCALCEQTVATRYIWCQICNHGGHVQCMQQWFTNNTTCATGCLHKCIPNTMLQEN